MNIMLFMMLCTLGQTYQDMTNITNKYYRGQTLFNGGAINTPNNGAINVLPAPYMNSHNQAYRYKHLSGNQNWYYREQNRNQLVFNGRGSTTMPIRQPATQSVTHEQITRTYIPPWSVRNNTSIRYNNYDPIKNQYKSPYSR